MIDMRNWPSKGAWNTEPSIVYWIDKQTRLPCLILRQSIGHLCGYVALPRNHALYEIHYTKLHLKVHGGLTFSGSLSHIAVMLNHKWWIGFDCAHYYDLCPAYQVESYEKTYRDIKYVKRQCKLLARQVTKWGAK